MALCGFSQRTRHATCILRLLTAYCHARNLRDSQLDAACGNDSHAASSVIDSQAAITRESRIVTHHCISRLIVSSRDSHVVSHHTQRPCDKPESRHVDLKYILFFYSARCGIRSEDLRPHVAVMACACLSPALGMPRHMPYPWTETQFRSMDGGWMSLSVVLTPCRGLKQSLPPHEEDAEDS